MNLRTIELAVASFMNDLYGPPKDRSEEILQLANQILKSTQKSVDSSTKRLNELIIEYQKDGGSVDALCFETQNSAIRALITRG